MNFLYTIPAVVLLLTVLLVAIAITSCGQIYVHRRFNGGDFAAHNEVGGVILAVSGTIYAVILGFLTVVVWEHYMDARALVVTESDAAIDAWHTAIGLPPQQRERVRDDLLRYANLMVNSEWPLMRHGAVDPDAGMVSVDALTRATAFAPGHPGETNAQAATIQQLTVVQDSRHRRMAINHGSLSWFEWLVLLIGATSVVCFCWLFGLRNRRTHLLMTSTVVTMIASMLVLLFELQYPFRSDIGVGPDAWQGAIDHIHQMQQNNF